MISPLCLDTVIDNWSKTPIAAGSSHPHQMANANLIDFAYRNGRFGPIGVQAPMTPTLNEISTGTERPFFQGFQISLEDSVSKDFDDRMVIQEIMR